MEEVKKISFPIKQTLTNDFLSNNFWKCLYTSAEHHLHYWILLPNNVKPIQLDPVRLKDMTVIGQYVRIDGSPYLEVLVMYEYCKFEMNASDWVQKIIYSLGESIIDYRIIESKSTGKYIDVLTSKKLSDGEEFISRITVLKDSDPGTDGANYILTKTSCYAKDYEELANKILHIVTNWDLTNKSQWQLAEPLKKFSFPNDNKIEFYVPNSWEISFDTDKIRSEAPRFIFSHDISDENKGIINAFFYQIDFINKHEIVFDKFFERLKNLEGSKYELKEFEKVETNEIKNPVIECLYRTTGTYCYEKANLDANIQIAIIKTKIGWYYFDLVGPKPNLTNYYWEANKRCLELIIGSFNNLNFNEKTTTNDVQRI